MLQCPTVERVFLRILPVLVVRCIRERVFVLSLELLVEIERERSELVLGQLSREDKQLQINLLCTGVDEANLTSLPQQYRRVLDTLALSITERACVEFEPHARHLMELEAFAPVADERVGPA